MASQTVLRLVYKQVMPGDIDKWNRQGARAGTGGGAMDLRIRPESSFGGILNKMYSVSDSTPSGKAFRTAQVNWIDKEGNRQSVKSELWSPTNARPNEMRIAQISKIGGFAPSMMPPAKQGERFYLLFEENGVVWATVVSEQDLNGPNVEPHFASKVLDTLAKAQENGKTARGWMEYSGGLLARERHHFD